MILISMPALSMQRSIDGSERAVFLSFGQPWPPRRCDPSVGRCMALERRCTLDQIIERLLFLQGTNTRTKDACDDVLLPLLDSPEGSMGLWPDAVIDAETGNFQLKHGRA